MARLDYGRPGFKSLPSQTSGVALQDGSATELVSLASSSSRSSDGNSSLLNEGGSTSRVPQASVELAGYGNVVWSDSICEWLVDGAGLQ